MQDFCAAACLVPPVAQAVSWLLSAIKNARQIASFEVVFMTMPLTFSLDGIFGSNDTTTWPTIFSVTVMRWESYALDFPCLGPNPIEEISV